VAAIMLSQKRIGRYRIVDHLVDVRSNIIRIDWREPMPADEEGGRCQSRTSEGTKLGNRLTSPGDDDGLSLRCTIDDLAPVVTKISD
jgi:hypothetical protein